MAKNLVLILNCGSSSIKFAVIDPQSSLVSLSGLVQNIGSHDANIKYKQEKQAETHKLPNIDYHEALVAIIKIIQSFKNITTDIKAIGHRVVHGGEKFTKSAIITEKVLQAIRDCSTLAPLHNPANVLGIESTMREFPGIKQVAVFDTAFHQTMPEYAYIYPIPYDLYQKYGIRRYGFHGTSHRFVCNQAALALEKNINKCAFITAHLGNGCSVAAVLNGKSVDTSMGFTPLEGLVMGTRSGDIDPSLHVHLVDNLGYDIHKVTDILNKQSGLLGISGTDSDMRTIESKAIAGEKRALLALEIFCYRLAKYIASLTVPLGRIDALIFTGGIGENSPIVRERTLTWIKLLGFKIDLKHNDANGKENNGIITKEGSPIAMVVPTNEELLIAQDTLALTLNS
ncbi:MAG: acetate kinase [Gammaproteobacteria bacterium]|nr:acetate kinase [Gammaproteobacteria bacterium]